MFGAIRWRIAAAYAVLTLAAMGGAAFHVTRYISRQNLAPELERQLTADLQRIILIAALLALVGVILLAVLIADRTTRPVRQLTQVAARLAQGDLNARLFPTTKDEVSDLTRAFNEMAQQLTDQVTSLDKERRRLTTILTHMADGVLITDSMGRVQLINPTAQRLLKLKEEAAGRSYAEVVRHHQLIELWQRCYDSGQEQVEALEIERQQLFLQAIVTPVQEAGGGSYLIILQDLTQIRRLETIRRDFISNISHELRTPLAALRALVETLRDGALEDPPAAVRFLDRIEYEVDALTQMVQELLDLSRIESRRAPLRLGPTPLPALIMEAVDRFRSQVERAGLELVVKVDESLPPVVADADRARAVITNLLHNAVKFTPEGGRITVSAEAHENEAVIAVADTGVGIPSSDLPRIFERFFKADRARSGGGAGLGLAIAKHIVEAHGGEIWAKSKEGKGSVFYFTLQIVNKPFTSS